MNRTVAPVYPFHRLQLLNRLLLLCLLAVPCFGQPLLYYNAPIPPLFSAAPMSTGFLFHGRAVIEQLGMFDNFGEIAETHVAALWVGQWDGKNLNWSLIATSTFEPGDDALRLKGYRFHPITPVQLIPPHYYLVSVHYPSNSTAPRQSAAAEYRGIDGVGLLVGLSQIRISNSPLVPSGIISIPDNEFLAGNFILSTNKPPVASAFVMPALRVLSNTSSEKWIISPDGEPVTLVLDASGSSDPEGDPLEFAWLTSRFEGSRWSMPVPLGTGALFTNAFAVDQSFGLHVRVSDPIQSSYASTRRISIYRPETAIDRVKEVVRYATRPRGALRRGMLRRLTLAQRYFRRERSAAGLRQLLHLQQHAFSRLEAQGSSQSPILHEMTQAIVDAFSLAADIPAGLTTNSSPQSRDKREWTRIKCDM